MALNPLANPKGVKLNCELCSKPAFIFCTKCRVTYYCDEEHQNIDWIGIHEKICQFLIPLRATLPSTCNSEEEREHQRKQKITREKNMIELTRTIGQKLLFEGKYEYAIPAALQSLKFSINVYGLDSIELVPAYLILGEACIGLDRLSQAEEYLSQAKWTVVKTVNCKNKIKSQLHRNLGMLHATKGNNEEALHNLAEDIYYASLCFGTDDIQTSGGYFHMANVFYSENKLDVAFSLYSQITDIWYDHLSRLVSQRTRVSPAPTGIGPAQFEVENESIEKFDEAKSAEAIQVLNAILELRSKQASPPPSVMMQLFSSLAMLFFILENFPTASEYCVEALEVSKKGMNNDEEKLKILMDLYEALEQKTQE